MKANEIKSYFRKLGIPVRVRIVAVKRPFAQVWIQGDMGNYLVPLKYSFEFPLALRQKLLRIVYGQDCNFADGGNAGNVRPYSLSFSVDEWAKLIA